MAKSFKQLKPGDKLFVASFRRPEKGVQTYEVETTFSNIEKWLFIDVINPNNRKDRAAKIVPPDEVNNTYHNFKLFDEIIATDYNEVSAYDN